MGEVSYKGHRYPAEIIAHCLGVESVAACSAATVIDDLSDASTRQLETSCCYTNSITFAIG